ncbi:MAG TPA: hydroxymethylbilane synthase, partial [Planctomycetaceae bacterium]
GGVTLPDDVAVALAALPDHAVVGTGSPRRRAQLLRLRPDLRLEDIRGNVDTRLRKLDEGRYDALVLAEAGLVRLGLGERVSARLTPPALLPAVGQGALGLECRADDEPTLALLSSLDDPAARVEVTAERSLLASLRAGCQAPVGTYARIESDRLRLDAVVLSPDGRRRFAASVEGRSDDAAGLGRRAAEELLSGGADALLR